MNTIELVELAGRDSTNFYHLLMLALWKSYSGSKFKDVSSLLILFNWKNCELIKLFKLFIKSSQFENMRINWSYRCSKKYLLKKTMALHKEFLNELTPRLFPRLCRLYSTRISLKLQKYLLLTSNLTVNF